MSDGERASAGRGSKSPSAFRTTSEVAEELDLPPHVLRFWESKFPQLKPVKGGGGRRYYRPEDVALLRRIQERLYRDGYTIRGVQKLLREKPLAEKPPPAGSPRSVASRGTPAGAAGAPLVPRDGLGPAKKRPSSALLRARLEKVRGELRAIRVLLDQVLKEEKEER